MTGHKLKQGTCCLPINDEMLLSFCVEAELNAIFSTKRGSSFKNLLSTSLVGRAPTCEKMCEMPMSTPLVENDDNSQSSSKSIDNETNANANSKKEKLLLDLVKEVDKCGSHDLNEANLGDTFPVVAWKEGDPNHAKDYVRRTIKKL